MNNIRIEGLTKKIKGNVILDNISLELNGGKIYGLIGKNGSGKTMLIRSIAGLMKPTNGRILYNDKELYKDIDLIPKLGIVIENIGLYPEFTVFKNLRMLADIRNIIDDNQIKDTMKAVGLDTDDKRKVRKYSLGMRQKLVLAQAFMEDPDVIILDEPTNALDENAVRSVYDLCRKAVQRNAVIVIASHSKEDISQLCDQKFIITEGRCHIEEEFS